MRRVNQQHFPNRYSAFCTSSTFDGSDSQPPPLAEPVVQRSFNRFGASLIWIWDEGIERKSEKTALCIQLNDTGLTYINDM